MICLCFSKNHAYHRLGFFLPFGNSVFSLFFNCFNLFLKLFSICFQSFFQSFFNCFNLLQSVFNLFSIVSICFLNYFQLASICFQSVFYCFNLLQSVFIFFSICFQLYHIYCRVLFNLQFSGY